MAVEMNQVIEEVTILDKTQAGADAAVRSMERVADGADKMSAGVKVSASGFEVLNKAQASAASALNRLKAQTDPTEAAIQRLARAEQVLDRAIRQGVSTEEEKIRVLGQLRRQLSGVSTANDNAARSVATGAAHYRQFGTVAQQAGYQVGDFFTQLASGQGIIRPLIQQGTQFISMFGPWGAILGAAGAVVGALAVMLFDMGDGASAAEKAVKSYDAAVGAVDRNLQQAIASGRTLRSGFDEESTSVQDLTRHYASLSDTMREVERLRLTAARNQVVEAIADQRAALGGLLDELDDAAELSRRMSEVGTQMPMGQQPESVLEMVRALDEFRRAAPDDIEAAGRLAVALDKVAQQGGPFSDAARKAALALADPATKSAELADKLRLLDANMAVLAGTATATQKELINTGDGISKVDKAAAALADQRADTIEGLQEELRYQQNLRQAYGQGEEAINAVKDAREADQIIQKLKLDQDGLEADLIRELIQRRNEEKRAIEGITDAQKEAEAQAKKLAAEQKKAAEEAAKAYEKVIDRIGEFSEQALGDSFFKTLKGETVDFAEFFEDTILRALANVLAAAATQQIVIPIATQVVGGVPGLFGLSGQAAGVAQSAAGSGLFGSGNPLSSITNLIPTDGLFNNFAMSGLGQSLGLSYGAGTLATAPGMFFAGGAVPAGVASTVSGGLAATGPLGGFGTVAGGATASSGGAIGAATAGGSLAASGGLTGLGASLGAALPYIGIGLALLSILGPSLFGGNPSVGPVGIADFSPGLGHRKAFDVAGIDPFTADNGGNGESLRPIAEAIADLIADSADRFSATIEESLRFRVANYQGPESGSGRSQGFEVNAFIRGEAEKRVAEGQSQERAIFEALKFAVQEAFKFDSATLAEAAANTAATTTEGLLADLEFADHFERLGKALDDLGQGVDANTLALAQSTVATQDAARTWVEQNGQPVVDSLSKALELFPAEVTKQVGERKAVKSVLVGTRGEDERYLNPGDAGYDAAMAAPGARVFDRIIGTSEEVTAKSDNYAANLERVGLATEIATGSIDQLVQQITGEWDPALKGPFAQALETGNARLDALKGTIEDVNDQIEAANTAFPELNASLIDTTQVIADATDALQASLQKDFNDSIQAQTNAANGLGVINTIQGFVDARDVNLSDAAALGIQYPQDRSNPVQGLFEAQIRQSLGGASLADLNNILNSGQIVDDGARAIITTILNEQALAAVRQDELAGLQDLRGETDAFAKAANDNARRLRQAAAGLLVDPNLSPLSPLDRLNEARRQFQAAFDLANDGTPNDAESQDAIQRLPDLSQTLLEAARDYYASSAGYQDEFNRVQAALASTASRQESIEEQQLGVLKSIDEQIGALGGLSGTPSDTAAAGGFDFGRNPDRNRNIYNALAAVGLPTPTGFGQGQLNALRDQNPAVDAIVRALGFASGGVFVNGVPVNLYGNGDIFDRPTLFGMGGGLGVLGEAGPEAIMPLERIGGRLGVRAAPAANDRGVVAELRGLRSDMAGLRADMARSEARVEGLARQIQSSGIMRGRLRVGG